MSSAELARHCSPWPTLLRSARASIARHVHARRETECGGSHPSNDLLRLFPHVLLDHIHFLFTACITKTARCARRVRLCISPHFPSNSLLDFRFCGHSQYPGHLCIPSIGPSWLAEPQAPSRLSTSTPAASYRMNAFFPSAGNTLSNYEICNDAKIIIMPLLWAYRWLRRVTPTSLLCGMAPLFSLLVWFFYSLRCWTGIWNGLWGWYRATLYFYSCCYGHIVSLGLRSLLCVCGFLPFGGLLSWGFARNANAWAWEMAGRCWVDGWHWGMGFSSWSRSYNLRMHFHDGACFACSCVNCMDYWLFNRWGMPRKTSVDTFVCVDEFRRVKLGGKTSYWVCSFGRSVEGRLG